MRDYALMKLPIEEIGRALALCSDDEQAVVINTIARELKVVCRQCNPDSNMQVCYWASKLDRHGKELIISLADFVKAREDLEK